MFTLLGSFIFKWAPFRVTHKTRSGCNVSSCASTARPKNLSPTLPPVQHRCMSLTNHECLFLTYRHFALPMTQRVPNVVAESVYRVFMTASEPQKTRAFGRFSKLPGHSYKKLHLCTSLTQALISILPCPPVKSPLIFW